MMRQDKSTQQAPPCHPEQSEGSLRDEMLRCAQHDDERWELREWMSDSRRAFAIRLSAQHPLTDRAALRAT